MFSLAESRVLLKDNLLSSLFIITFILSAIIHRRGVYQLRNPKGLPTPPGPKGLPFFGILFDRPTFKPWVEYARWTKTYGDMVYFEVMGQSYLVLNSLKRVNDLLDKRSSNYSGRSRMPMAIELMSWDYNFAMQPYGAWWRRHRRLFNEHFHQNTVYRYQPIQTREVNAFLQRLLVSPQNFMHHIRHTFASTIMNISYGINIQLSEDPYISRAETALEGLAAAGITGSYFVDFIPLLKYVPMWFPGAGFRRKAEFWRQVNDAVAEIPFRHVEDQMKAGNVKPCVAASLIENLPDKADPSLEAERVIAKNVAAVSYIGGADTTVSSVQTFFLAMALHPEIQRKAKEELDRVVGRNHLPDFSHRVDLPYINAIVKETSRWNLVIPLAVPHMCEEDDEYDGYFIPKGTVVMGNAWAILNDPSVYSEPEKFMPERYIKDGKLDPTVRDPVVAAFGFGRRICPGRHLSDNSLYAMISSVLSVYDITPVYDDQGNTVDLEVEFTSGMLTYPVPFKCRITPRSHAAETLVRELIIE